MKLNESQWAELATLIPEPKKRADGRGRPWTPNREVLEGILWVLKTGARWKDVSASRGTGFHRDLTL
jgi:transposase